MVSSSLRMSAALMSATGRSFQAAQSVVRPRFTWLAVAFFLRPICSRMM
jgi:hypothetical protein